MVNFNTTAICIKGTQSVQRSCNTMVTGVHDTITPIETTVVVVASALILWQIGYQIHEYRRMRIHSQHNYEMVCTSDHEEGKQVPVAPTRLADNKQIATRVNSIIHTLAFAFVVGQLVFFYDMTRRMASTDNCIPVNDYAMQICIGILNATYHSVIPGK